MILRLIINLKKLKLIKKSKLIMLKNYQINFINYHKALLCKLNIVQDPCFIDQ